METKLGNTISLKGRDLTDRHTDAQDMLHVQVQTEDQKSSKPNAVIMIHFLMKEAGNPKLN